MSAYITTLRAAVRDALTAAPTLSGVSVLRSSVKALDESQFPAVTVRVPNVPASRADQASHLRTVELVVDLRRAGGEELEDQLVTDAGAIEAAVMPALEAQRVVDTCLDFDVTGYGFDFDGGGAQRYGRVVVGFSCRVYTDF